MIKLLVALPATYFETDLVCGVFIFGSAGFCLFQFIY